MAASRAGTPNPVPPPPPARVTTATGSVVAAQRAILVATRVRWTDRRRAGHLHWIGRTARVKNPGSIDNYDGVIHTHNRSTDFFISVTVL